MATIAIVGGHGKIALILARILAAQGHTVRSTIRDPRHAADVEAGGGIPVPLDIEAADATAFATALDGADAVVFSAGAGADGRVDRKRTVDLEGSLKSIEAAETVGIARFVQVSAVGADEPVADDASPVWRAYVEAKRDADRALRSSTLDWTIVRPGPLTDEPPSGLVRIGDRVERAPVPRADVAAVLAACLHIPATIGAQFELVSGDDTIETALGRL